MFERDPNDKFNLFSSKIERIDSENHKLPTYGRLTDISHNSSQLNERKDGHLQLAS